MLSVHSLLLPYTRGERSPSLVFTTLLLDRDKRLHLFYRRLFILHLGKERITDGEMFEDELEPDPGVEVHH